MPNSDSDDDDPEREDRTDGADGADKESEPTLQRRMSEDKKKKAHTLLLSVLIQTKKPDAQPEKPAVGTVKIQTEPGMLIALRPVPFVLAPDPV